MSGHSSLRELRTRQGYSQKGMAGYIGVSLSMYEKVERGTKLPSRGFMEKIKYRYPDRSIDDLFFANKQHE